MKNFLSSTYIALTLAILGSIALVTAILVSWPAVAYLASKLF